MYSPPRTSSDPDLTNSVDSSLLYYTSPSNSTSSLTERHRLLYTNETPEDEPLPPLSNKMLRGNEMLEIRILGIPESGAKSRVETQIKLCIQLITQQGQKVVGWSYIQLNENMLARSRLRKTQHVMDGSVATMVSDESKVLQLEAKVVCTSNTDHPIRMCVGCVRREKKRADRTKSKGKMILLPKDLEAEKDRILLFNCPSMLNFSSGDAILPTRITCYCRHHHEKIGFRICFKMRNHHGQVVATGISPPIMITDDHKSVKQSPQRKLSMTEEEDLQTPSSNEDMLMSADYANNISQDFLFNIFPQTPDIPQVDRLIPTEGPVYGGMDVTLLGSGFYRGLTCLFGERPATTTFWNANTLVCVLPPATHTGPVVVSFQEHPLVMEGQDVPIFTYRDASDQALYELALQVVGIKMTGKLHDPKHVAMHIVQGGERHNSGQQYLLDVLEKYSDMDLCLQNAQGHTLLHLAVILNNKVLVKKILKNSQEQSSQAFLNKQDRNNMTALHFACQLVSIELVQMLLDAGASTKLASKWGLPSESCASREIINLLNQQSNRHTYHKSIDSRVYLGFAGKNPQFILCAFKPLNTFIVTFGLFIVYILSHSSIFDYSTPPHMIM